MPYTLCDIIGLGAIAVDDMLYVDSYPSIDTKVHIRGNRRQGGGNTSCGLAAAARLGSSCALLGRLGKNEFSSFTREQQTALGVDLSRMLYDDDSGPIHCTIIVSGDTASRTILVDYSAFKPLETSDLRSEWFIGAKVLLVDHIQRAAILPAVKMASEAGLQIVSDIERDLPHLTEIRKYVHHFISGSAFALPYTKCGKPDEACASLARSGKHQTVVVTAGDAGCYWCESNNTQVKHVPAHTIEPVDTTGCGDVFHGAFCHGLVRGWPMEHIVRFANAAAALKATRTGGWDAVPTTEDVECLLDTNG